MVLHTYSAGCSFTPPMVEARRIELLSENKSAQLSTSVACLLSFPFRYRQAGWRSGSFIKS